MNGYANIDGGTPVLCWSHDRQKVYRCRVSWQFAGGGQLVPYGECGAYYFVLTAAGEGATWIRGRWTRENVYALLALHTMEEKTQSLAGNGNGYAR